MDTGSVINLPNPKLAESFLLSHDDVVDASVWFDRGSLKACVTLVEDARTDVKALERACVQTVGPVHTPDDFVLIAARRRAA